MIGAEQTIITIDAATYAGSVCISRGTSVLAEGTTPMRGAEEERLMPLVASTLEKAGVPVEGVDAIVCGEGPGSFTSLRIAAAIAKGIAFARSLPLHAMSSLALMVAGSDRTRAAGEYLAVLDALRGEYYAARCVVDAAGEVTEVEPFELLPAERLTVLAHRGVQIVGTSQPIEAAPRARGIVRLQRLLAASTPVALDRWEPAYGRRAEAQVQWEARHGRPLPVG